MQLFFLFLLLLVPFLILTLVDRVTQWKLAPVKRARVGLSLFFLFTAIGHFVRTEEMASMLPFAVAYRNPIIYLTGVLELLGAIGVWIPRLTKLTGVCLILMLIAVLPANIYSAINRIDFGGHGSGPVYLLARVPFQFLVMAWAYFATEQNWFRRTLTI